MHIICVSVLKQLRLQVSRITLLSAGFLVTDLSNLSCYGGTFSSENAAP